MKIEYWNDALKTIVCQENVGPIITHYFAKLLGWAWAMHEYTSTDKEKKGSSAAVVQKDC